MQRCLILDRSPIVLKVAKRILASMDYAVVTAESPSEALNACRNDMPDVVVVDMSLRDTDPFALLSEIRRMKGRARPFIVASMIEAELVQMTKCRRAGADEFLLKPFDRETLEASFADYKRLASAIAA